jgi:hypothetical protein
MRHVEHSKWVTSTHTQHLIVTPTLRRPQESKQTRNNTSSQCLLSTCRQAHHTKIHCRRIDYCNLKSQIKTWLWQKLNEEFNPFVSTNIPVHSASQCCMGMNMPVHFPLSASCAVRTYSKSLLCWGLQASDIYWGLTTVKCSVLSFSWPSEQKWHMWHGSIVWRKKHSGNARGHLKVTCQKVKHTKLNLLPIISY